MTVMLLLSWIVYSSHFVFIIDNRILNSRLIVLGNFHWENVLNFHGLKNGGHFEGRAAIGRRNTPHHNCITVHTRKLTSSCFGIISLERTTRSSPHHVAQHRPTGSEITPPYAPRSSRFGSEPPSVEDDVDVWHHTIVRVACQKRWRRLVYVI